MFDFSQRCNDGEIKVPCNNSVFSMKISFESTAFPKNMIKNTGIEEMLAKKKEEQERQEQEAMEKRQKALKEHFGAIDDDYYYDDGSGQQWVEGKSDEGYNSPGGSSDGYNSPE